MVLAALAGVAAPCLGSAEPPLSDLQARGEAVMRRFCLSCHGSPGGAVEDPLGPRLRAETWGDPEQAYALLGQLSRVNRRMDQPFTGSEEDRRALAAWLAWRAAQNREPLLRRAAPWILGFSGVCSAAAILLAVRRRGGRSPRPG